MFGGGDMEIPQELKEIVRNSSEAEVTELVMMSLKEAVKNPDAFAKAGNIPPMMVAALRGMPTGDEKLRPMAQSMAKMLIAQIKHGKTPDPASFMSEMMNFNLPGAQSTSAGALTNSGLPEEVSNLIEQSKRCKMQDNFEEAERLLKSALTICERDCPQSAAICHVLVLLATTQVILENYSEAEANLKRFLTLSEKHLPPDDHHIADGYFGLAMVRENQGKSSDADLLYTKAASIAEKAYADKPLELAHMLETLANFYEGQKLYRKSDPYFQRSIALHEKALGSEDLEVAEQFVRYTLILEGRGHFSEAEMWCYRALQVKHALLDAKDADLARNQALLASLYVGQEQYAKAEPILKQTIEILQEVDEDELYYPLEVYLRLLKATNRDEEANEIAARLAEYEVDAGDESTDNPHIE
ncbi:MAG TPA: tetratricopeptide repeat protein [Oculatellaceae cyanobacterium]